jgi:SsrA-binding protein
MKIISKNKRAYHDYSFEKDYEVGIILVWHEVKAIKMWQINIKDAIIRIQNRELWIKNMDVPLYKKTSPLLVPWYDTRRNRKLLINKKELAKISAMVDKPGNVIVPLEIYLNNKGFIKLKIWVWKLMRKVEKKQVLKEKDIKRQMDKEIRNY